MKIATIYQFTIDKQFEENELLKGIYIAVIHAKRVPPHIGLITDGKYHSLSLKGQNINTPVAALIKTTRQGETPSLFIRIKKHNTFSTTYLKEHFITNIQQFPRVDVGVATCLSPIKLFFDEVYNIPMNDINYLFELIPRLYSEGLIENSSALFVDEKNYQLPVYSIAEINAEIMQVRHDFKKG